MKLDCNYEPRRERARKTNVKYVFHVAPKSDPSSPNAHTTHLLKRIRDGVFQSRGTRATRRLLAQSPVRLDANRQDYGAPDDTETAESHRLAAHLTRNRDSSTLSPLGTPGPRPIVVTPKGSNASQARRLKGVQLEGDVVQQLFAM